MTQEKSTPVETGLYAHVEPLQAGRHGDLFLKKKTDYSFARKMNSILLTTTEFPMAAQHYPIVFARIDEAFMPFAVTGYKQGENLHIDEEGQWRENFYIPAFVRRYPFIFMENHAEESLSLSIDRDCPGLNSEEGEPLYTDGKPSELINRALDFSKAYHVEAQKTRQLTKKLEEADLLVERNANFTLPGGETSLVSGFSIIDEQKLNGLEDEAFLALRKGNALAQIYCHLLSMRSWGNILL